MLFASTLNSQTKMNNAFVSATPYNNAIHDLFQGPELIGLSRRTRCIDTRVFN